MGFVARFLAGSPAHRRQLIDDPSLIPRAVDEFFRRFGVSSTTRTMTRDFEYKGLHFKKGDKVYVFPTLYGLDERKFERPLEIDFHRKNVIHATFGAGPHRCPGSFLARMEIKVFMEEWLKRIPDFRIKPGDKPKLESGLVNCVHYLPLVWD
jgi:cytochrome P450